MLDIPKNKNCLSRTMFAQTHLLFCPLFQKWLSTSSGAVKGAQPLLGISFWELFLCASGFKEKVDKR